MQEKCYTIIGKVNTVIEDTGWCYLACEICPKGVIFTESGHWCPKCNKSSNYPVYRYYLNRIL